MSIRVVRFRELDVTGHLSFQRPILNPNNHVYNTMIFYDNKPFILETPYLKNPFGLVTYRKGGESGGREERSITLMSCGTYTDSQEVIRAFFDELKKLDEMMIVYGTEYSELLFGKKMEEDEVRRIYQPGVRGKIDKNGVPYPDKISPKVMKKNEMPNIVLFKNSKTPLEVNSWEDLAGHVQEGMSIRGIIHPRVFLMSNSFGIVYEYDQIKLPSMVSKTEMKLGVYSFSDE